ncbi:MAG: hypothetical protein GVY29_10350 [Spirochaetes bacterium]|jgi:hypothetical protein|nr:hypothetical protein [Spirochaetota bacterium]
MMHGWGMGGFGMGFPLFGLVPLILVGAGLYILLRNVGAFDRLRRGNTRNRDDHSLAATHGVAAPEVFRLAKRYGGILTVSDLVSELGVDPKEGENLFEALTDGRRVDMEVGDNGVVRYVFREFTP